MKIRGTYSILQTDRIMRDEEILAKARDEIAAQIVESVREELNSYIVQEEPSPKYPFGRYYLDLSIEPTEF